MNSTCFSLIIFWSLLNAAAQLLLKAGVGSVGVIALDFGSIFSVGSRLVGASLHPRRPHMLCRQWDTCTLSGGRECCLSDAVVGIYRQCHRCFCRVWRAIDTDKARRNRYYLPRSFRSRQELKRNLLRHTSVPPLMRRRSRR